ncbi:U-box domain-containing protein 9, partial [Cucurbita argyrosperma subsp. argyrosperma]
MADKESLELLKKDIKELLQRIVDQDDFECSIADEAIEKLNSLKLTKMAAAAAASAAAAAAAAAPVESGGDSARTALVMPDEFRCPISGELMEDPVLLKTGQTYDRPFINKWFNKGHNTCPRTNEVLHDMTLTPNRSLRSMILKWCIDNKLELPKLTYEETVAHATESHLDELLNQLLSSSLSDQKLAAKELRQIAKWNHEFRSLFAKLPDSIERLLHPISVDHVNLHPDLQEDLITTVLNISLSGDNKKRLVENQLVLSLLIQSLQYGSSEAKANAAAAIFSLSLYQENKIAIGNAGAIKHLVGLLDEGHPVVMRDAASAIFTLCTASANKEKAVSSGVVVSVLRNITEGVLVDELVSVLALLSNNMKAISIMCKLNAVSCMLRVIRESTSQGVKENCISILDTISSTYRSKLKEIQEDENANGMISKLSQNGNSRAKRKAMSVLEKLQRAGSITHTA